jgi:predicted metal-dependent phosphoesterase TrpH
MLRADFHHHIDTDPIDGKFVRHSAGELIDRAAATGLNVLAITCHESVPYDGAASRYAADRGVLLLRGMEATVDGHHVLLLNFPEFPSGVCSMEEIVARKTPDALVIAPHPFYPVGLGMGDTLASYPTVFDAVEFSGLYTPLTRRFNRRATEYARRIGLSVVGNSDTHFLWQLGRTYTLMDAAAEPTAVIDALRHGRVQLVTQPLSWVHVASFLARSGATVDVLRDSLIYMMRILRRTRAAQWRVDHPSQQLGSGPRAP